MEIKVIKEAGGLGPTEVVLELLEGTARELLHIAAALRELAGEAAQLPGGMDLEPRINDQRTALTMRAVILESMATTLGDPTVLPRVWKNGPNAVPEILTEA